MTGAGAKQSGLCSSVLSFDNLELRLPLFLTIQSEQDTSLSSKYRSTEGGERSPVLNIAITGLHVKMIDGKIFLSSVFY